MFEEHFIQLVEENGGFEFYQAYRGDVVAPTITGLRMTEEKFNDNPVVAFTLTAKSSASDRTISL